MMYSNKLAFAIKVDGRVLRELGDKVYIPFGSEYTILIKNLNTTRAFINISIDGTNATGNGLVIDAGKEIELERFIKTDLNKGNRFKFIERTSGIETHRGIKIEDGLIVINYQFEVAVNQSIFTKIPTWFGIITNDSSTNINVDSTTTGLLDDSCCRGIDFHQPNVTYTNCSVSNQRDYVKTCTIPKAMPVNENGITVPGSLSEQKFTQTTLGTLESIKHNMVIKLLGKTDDHQNVSKPLTVQVKANCITCGRKNRATNKFCADCGTALVIAV